MVYTFRFFLLKYSLFHKSNVFGFCINHILYTGCAKIKKNNSGAKRLKCARARAHTLYGVVISKTHSPFRVRTKMEQNT